MGVLLQYGLATDVAPNLMKSLETTVTEIAAQIAEARRKTLIAEDEVYTEQQSLERFAKTAELCAPLGQPTQFGRFTRASDLYTTVARAAGWIDPHATLSEEQRQSWHADLLRSMKPRLQPEADLLQLLKRQCKLAPATEGFTPCWPVHCVALTFTWDGGESRESAEGGPTNRDIFIYELAARLQSAHSSPPTTTPRPIYASHPLHVFPSSTPRALPSHTGTCQPACHAPPTRVFPTNAVCGMRRTDRVLRDAQYALHSDALPRCPRLPSRLVGSL